MDWFAAAKKVAKMYREGFEQNQTVAWNAVIRANEADKRLAAVLAAVHDNHDWRGVTYPPEKCPNQICEAARRALADHRAAGGGE